MNEHIEIWIDAYLDGELNEIQIAKFKKHMIVCSDCLVQLEEREKLSTLLQSFTLPKSSQTTEQFVRNINLLLPRIQTKPSKKLGLGIGWILVSMGFLAVLSFTQVINWMSNLILLIPGAERLVTQVVSLPTFIEKVVPWLYIFVKQWSLFSGWSYFYASLTFTTLALTGLLTLIYLSWLVFWWDNQLKHTKTTINYYRKRS